MKEGITPELSDVILAGVERVLLGVHVAMSGRVIAYNADEQSAQIQPTVNPLVPTEDGDEPIALPIIPAAPVLFPRAGGYRFTFPIKKGDTGLLIVASHAIDTWLRQNSPKDVEAVDPRRFHLSDATFLPGLSQFAALTPADPDDLVLEKIGGVAIHLNDAGEINLGSKTASDALALASKVEARLEAIFNAINGAAVLAGDGGAVFKAAIITALNLVSLPGDFPKPVGSTTVKAD